MTDDIYLNLRSYTSYSHINCLIWKAKSSSFVLMLDVDVCALAMWDDSTGDGLGNPRVVEYKRQKYKVRNIIGDNSL